MKTYTGTWETVLLAVFCWGCLVSPGWSQVVMQREFVRTGSADYEILAQQNDDTGVHLRAMHGTADTLLVRRAEDTAYLVRYLQDDGTPADGWIARDAVGYKWTDSDILSMSDDLAAALAPTILSAVRENTQWNRVDRLLLSLGYIRHGMSQTQIVVSFGEPETRNRFRTATAQFEQLTYRLADGSQFLLVCENGRLSDHKMIEAVSQLGRANEAGLLRITPELHPHRSTGVSLMAGGGILIGAGLFLFWNEDELTANGRRDVTKFGTMTIVTGALCEAIGIYLYQYTRKIQTTVLPMRGGLVLNSQWTF